MATQLNRFLTALLLVYGCGTGSALEPEQIWERVSPSVVRIEAEMLDGERMQGSGFVCEIDGKKFILSNRHVVQGAKKVQVGHSETNLFQSSGYRIAPDLDLAIIELPTQLTLPLLKKRDSEAKTGEKVYAVGFPLGLNKSISQGLVSSQTEKLIQFDAPISSGSSGGPLVDKEGQVIAVVTVGSLSGTDQVVQNINFGIKTTFVPRVVVFRDPILSFYDAWLELVKVENGLIDQIRDLRVIELLAYLRGECIHALAAAESKGDVSAEQIQNYREHQDALLRAVTDRHGSIERAGTAVGSFLKVQVKHFDRIPEIFLGLGNQALLREFIHDKRPGGVFRLKIDEAEIVPLLRVSLEHPKAKYEDAAFQTDFLIRNLAALKNPSHPLTKKLSVFWADARSGKWEEAERKSPRLDYSNADLTDAGSSARTLMQSLGAYQPPSEIYSRMLGNKLSSKELVQHYGGLETEIASMFGRMGIERLQKGDVEKAIASLSNEITNRRQPEWRLLAHFNACAGRHESAYSLYLNGFTRSVDAVEAFSLERGGRITRPMILDEIVDEADRFSSYTEAIRRNLRAWRLFVSSKPGYAMRSLPSLADALASREFLKMDELQRALVIDSFSKAARRENKWAESWKVLNADPAARLFYAKYF